MLIYNYSRDTGEYLGSGVASQDPLDIGNYLIPAYATIEPPLTVFQGFIPCFIDGIWYKSLKHSQWRFYSGIRRY